jgi:putative SOS response-associated peptidase YedK
VRHPKSRYWEPWLEAPQRCLVPVTSFSEYDHRTEPPTVTWFGINDSRPLFFFAGVWRPWTGRRGTKANPAEGDHLVFSFLTTFPNNVVKPVHPKAMPVLLLNEEARETWLKGSVSEALALQRSAPEDAVQIIARGEKEDPPPPRLFS